MGGYFVERQVRFPHPLAERLGGGRHTGISLHRKMTNELLSLSNGNNPLEPLSKKFRTNLNPCFDVLAKRLTIHQAYIVIGGDGWTKHQFFLNDLNDWVNTNEFVDVVRLDQFCVRKLSEKN